MGYMEILSSCVICPKPNCIYLRGTVATQKQWAWDVGFRAQGLGSATQDDSLEFQV